MVLGAMIFIPSFIKLCPSIKKFIIVGRELEFTDLHRQHGDLINLN
jgi:hypothetical protein